MMDFWLLEDQETQLLLKHWFRMSKRCADPGGRVSQCVERECLLWAWKGWDTLNWSGCFRCSSLRTLRQCQPSLFSRKANEKRLCKQIELSFRVHNLLIVSSRKNRWSLFSQGVLSPHNCRMTLGVSPWPPRIWRTLSLIQLRLASSPSDWILIVQMSQSSPYLYSNFKFRNYSFYLVN